MPASCAACRTRYQGGSNVTFHKFPAKDHSCLVQWAAFTGKGEDWRPTRFHRLCSRHFEPSYFNILNGKTYLRPGALPTRNRPTGHAQNKLSRRGRKRTSPEVFTKIPGATPTSTTTCANVAMDKAKSILQKPKPASKEVGQPEVATGKATRSTPCNVPEARTPRQFVPPTRKGANSQDTSAETQEKRPIIIHVTSLSSDSSSQRPSRLKRRPVKLRSGEFEEGAPLAKSSRRLRPLNQEEQLPAGPESSSEADPEAESEPEAEVQQDDELEAELEGDVEYNPEDYDSNASDVDAPDVVEESEIAEKPSSPVKVVTVRAGESLLISNRNAPSKTPLATAPSAKVVPSGDAASSISQLQNELARERNKNEELTMQFNKAKVVIENQCRNIVGLEETINSLRYRLVQMSAKCRSDPSPAAAEKEAAESK